MRASLISVALILCLAQSLPILGQPLTSIQTQSQLESMEKKFFEHDFSKEPSEYRLGRLEKFAFGQTSSASNDDRLKRLRAVMDLHPHLIQPNASAPTVSKSPSASKPSAAPSGNDQSDEDSGQSSHYPHVTNLEKAILKQSFESESIGNRLSRLETRVFGDTKSNLDLAARTDALEQFAETTLHQKAYAINPENDSDQPVLEIRPTRRIFGEPMQSIAGLPHDPSETQESDRAPVHRPVDPAVLSSTPPDVHARLLTRVAWCEQHLLGHTCPTLHLTERLHQINTLLFPADHEPDIKLMDRVDVLVKEVVMRQHPPLASAAGFQP